MQSAGATDGADSYAMMSVNDLLRLHPVTARVLNAFGIDTCCGGTLSLAQAAADACVPYADVTAAIEDAIAHARRVAAQ